MQQLIKLRLVRKSETGEWVVKVWVNGVYSESETYYTDSKADALDTMSAMARIFGKRGFGII